MINTELALSDLDACERAIHRQAKRAKGGDKDAKLEVEVLEKIKVALENGQMIRGMKLDKEELAAVSHLNFLTLKPTMYIANVAEDGFENNPYLDKVREIAAAETRSWSWSAAPSKRTSPNWTTKIAPSSWLTLASKSRA